MTSGSLPGWGAKTEKCFKEKEKYKTDVAVVREFCIRQKPPSLQEFGDHRKSHEICAPLGPKIMLLMFMPLELRTLGPRLEW